MSVIKLNESDLRLMVASAIGRILESTDERSGVIMSGKEDDIKGVVDYISEWWEHKNKLNPDSCQDIMLGSERVGKVFFYEGSVAPEVTSKLGIAEYYIIDFTIRDMEIDLGKYGSLIGFTERSTGGASYASENFMRYRQASMKFATGKVELTIPAFNGKLELQGLYSTLYHELNHGMTNLRISQRGFHGLSLADMNRDRSDDKHINMMRALNPDQWTQVRRLIQHGSDGETKLREMVFLVYGLWETTERNARAESLYGELYYMKSTPESFAEDFKKTDVYHNIELFNQLIGDGETIPDDSGIWEEVGELVGGLDKKAIKRKFLKRSKELNDVLYQKAMKVAKYYFSKQKGAGNQ